MENRTCETCARGKKETVVGNGITEPPYLSLVRCPNDNEYYKSLDAYCNEWVDSLSTET